MRPLHFLIVAAFCVTTTCAGLGQGFVDTVDPPFWWVDMPVQQVQLMVHGDALAQYQVSIDHPGVSIAASHHGDSPNYKFIYLDVCWHRTRRPHIGMDPSKPAQSDSRQDHILPKGTQTQTGQRVQQCRCHIPHHA